MDRLRDNVTPPRGVTELHGNPPVQPGHAPGLFDSVTCRGVTDRSLGLVLSLFPGVDLLGRAFREQGYTVVTGPDPLWGGDVTDLVGFPGRFDGIIGGPPCQDFSRKRRTAPTGNGVRLIREYLRVVAECQPAWFVMENVPGVPDVEIAGYAVQRFDLTDRECGGEQLRLRHWQYGSRVGQIIRPRRLSHCPRGHGTFAPAVLCVPDEASMTYSRACRLQGLPEPLRLPFSRSLKLRVIGNGVPMAMGRTVADAVTRPGPVTQYDCVCGCGRYVSPPARHALAACRKRQERRRRVTRPKVTFQP